MTRLVFSAGTKKFPSPNLNELKLTAPPSNLPALQRKSQTPREMIKKILMRSDQELGILIQFWEDGNDKIENDPQCILGLLQIQLIHQLFIQQILEGLSQ